MKVLSITQLVKGKALVSRKSLYVININADNNTVIVGNKKNLEINQIQLRKLNILATEKNLKNSKHKSKINWKTSLKQNKY